MVTHPNPPDLTTLRAALHRRLVVVPGRKHPIGEAMVDAFEHADGAQEIGLGPTWATVTLGVWAATVRQQASGAYRWWLETNGRTDPHAWTEAPTLDGAVTDAREMLAVLRNEQQNIGGM